jgi:hypothetical protein
MLSDDPRQLGNPVLCHQAVIVNEGDPLAARFGDSTQARRRQALLGLMDDAEWQDSGPLVCREDIRRVVAAVVLDHEKAPLDGIGFLLPGQRLEHPIE